MCVGYYNYDHGYLPEFAGKEDFEGQVIHPQFWPEDCDYANKEVLVIGSGATAITLVPSIAEKAKHVTMLQRSPTYLGSKPAIDPKANWLAKWFGRRAARWWFILSSMFIYYYCKWFPSRAKAAIINDIKASLGDKFEAKHFTPHYNPWDERVCLCPDGDFFESIKEGKTSIVTDTIDRFTQAGLRLQSGEELKADIIVTATGLEMLFMGGMEVVVDGSPIEPSQTYVYKGLMGSGVPNLYMATGYTNASWTLKVDLTNKYACRLINYLDSQGKKYCMPTAPADIESAPLLDLKSGYIQRGMKDFPSQGTVAPWKMHQNYILDKFTLKFTALDDNAIRFY
jgi:cation diffusion facilitator CzcD-associated flavoprotein CzcO